jgi:hypothetical protein
MAVGQNDKLYLQSQLLDCPYNFFGVSAGVDYHALFGRFRAYDIAVAGISPYDEFPDYQNDLPVIDLISNSIAE